LHDELTLGEPDSQAVPQEANEHYLHDKDVAHDCVAPNRIVVNVIP
jgi:hypothetical protein